MTKNNTIRPVDEDLYVFILDDANLDASLDQFKKLYALRTRTDKEFWLLDISSIIDEPNEILNTFHDLPLDIDDDLYLYKRNTNSLSIWEFYEINSSVPRKILHYAAWVTETGLRIKNTSKWSRRKNMEVTKFETHKMSILASQKIMYKT